MYSYQLIFAEIDYSNQSPAYYSEDKVQDNKAKTQKQTLDNQVEFQNVLRDQPQKSQQKTTIASMEQSKNSRQHNRIKVNSQGRKKYLEYKTGKKCKTNDLSVNVSTMLKSSFKQFQTFFAPEMKELIRLKQFKKAKSNLNSLRKLLSEQIDQNLSQQHFHQSQCRNDIKYENDQYAFKTFILSYLRESYFLRQSLLSKKMSFPKKIMFIKFLDSISKICLQPQKFKNWKNK